MNKLIHHVCGPICLIALFSLLARPVAAVGDESVKPVAVLSIASVDHLMEDFAYLTKAAGRSDVGIYLQLMSSSFIQSFDRTRPAGVLITIENDEPKGIGFLPVPDGRELLATLKDKGAEVDDLGNGITKLALGKGAYLKQQGEWLYFTDHPRHLSRLPEDPVAMLGGLDKQYGIAVRFFVSNIPQGMKDVADFSLQTKIDADLSAKQMDDPEIDRAFVASLRTSLKKWASTLINDSDQITIGWAVDSAKRRTYIDLHAQAKDGSSLARQIGSLTDSRSTFTGFFVDDAAAAFQGSLRVTEQGQEQISSVVDYVRRKAIKGIDSDPKAPESFKEIVNSVLDVVDRTVREGKTDVGATLLLAPGSFKFVGGVRVADGRALADAFQKLFELAKHAPEVPEVHFYDGKHGDLDLHTLILPLADSDEDTRKLMGENVDITIATGPEQLYFAFGKGSDVLLETIADRSRELGEQKVPPVDLRVAVKPLMTFLASIEPDSEKRQLLAEAIKQAQGGDGIQVLIQQIDNGIGCRVEIEEGVLELVGRASQQAASR